MSEFYLFGRPSELKQSEQEIRHVFRHLVTTLYSQKWKIVDQITDWSATLIRQIQEHVDDQRKLLDQIYEQKVSYLDTVRDQFLKQVLVYDEKNDIQQIHQLIKQCNNLKFEVAMLVYVERPIVSIQLMAEELSPQVYQHESIEEEQSQIKLIENNNNDINTNNNNSDEQTSSSPKMILVNTEATNLLPPPAIQSNNYDDQSIVNSHELKTNITQHSLLMEKCPICYMIFPKIMSVSERNLHINEHYKDD
ncbi:unnamed protein product [Adineta steineri]|uniref:Uncharacterized protein n=1 Tax=Adineta steineri TaxID=433720 RepID=A0A815FPY7_9BILA|nr:unnamed protein product [Adineta steineri]CAF1367533.1 unnamed protein product [Adineta steineri]CAF1587438.1 unnamed protein product [Adineta steineri]CAF3621244.1 unnamed protein product [Adineta steineri]